MFLVEWVIAGRYVTPKPGKFVYMGFQFISALLVIATVYSDNNIIRVIIIALYVVIFFLYFTKVIWPRSVSSGHHW